LENDELRFKYWENEVFINVSNDYELTFVEVKINAIHQRKESYLRRLTKQFLKMYDNLGDNRVRKLILSSDPTQNARTLHEQIQNLQYETLGVNEIETVTERYGIEKSHYLFFEIKREGVETVKHELNRGNVDEFYHLELIEQIFSGDLDPLREEVDQQPRFPPLREMKNCDEKVDSKQLEAELAKIPREESRT